MYTPLKELISGSEDKLIDKLLVYSKEREYTKYTSTLREAWRVSIEGLSNAIIDAIDIYGATPELSPDEDYSSDPIAAFGIKEAKLHRERGVELSMFLGLMKYYRQIYLDLIADMEFTSEIDKRYELFVHRVFDRIEIGFCTEWSNLSETVKMDELQEMNRLITNEKNKYLTIFTSFANPVILYDRNHKIENVNLPAADLLRVEKSPGLLYYNKDTTDFKNPAWLEGHFKEFIASQQSEKSFDFQISDGGWERFYEVNFSRMQDISEKYTGILAIFYETTVSKVTSRERELLIEELKKALVNVKTLRGMIPICSSCKKVRDDEGFWNQVEVYIREHSEAEFSHGLCPDCLKKLYPEYIDE